MNRKILVKIHLYFSAFFLPFLLLMAITGTSYLLSYKGEVTKTMLKTITIDQDDMTEEFIKSELAKIDASYSYEYLKTKSDFAMTRPTTRQSYEFEKNGNQVSIYEVRPNFLRSIIEIHKGHGPGLLKKLETVLGFGLIIILITGMLIAFTRKDHTRITVVMMSLGFFSLLGLFYLL